jgi:hypothetical protein
MSLFLTLTPEDARVLELEASRRGVGPEAVATELLTESLERVRGRPQPWSGAQALAYREAQGIPPLFADAPDSPEFARCLRAEAETRQLDG